jgi:hypothetical protein
MAMNKEPIDWSKQVWLGGWLWVRVGVGVCRCQQEGGCTGGCRHTCMRA